MQRSIGLSENTVCSCCSFFFVAAFFLRLQGVMSEELGSPAGLPSYNGMLEDVNARARVKVARSHFPISQLNVEGGTDEGVVDTKARNEFRENMAKLRQLIYVRSLIYFSSSMNDGVCVTPTGKH